MSETNNKLSYIFYQFSKTKKEFNETFINKNKDKSFNYRNKLNLIYIYSNNKNILSDENKKKLMKSLLKVIIFYHLHILFIYLNYKVIIIWMKTFQ